MSINWELTNLIAGRFRALEEGKPWVTAERWTDPATGEWDGRSVLLTASEPVFDGYATTWVVDGTAGDWDSAIPQALQTVELSDEIERVMARGGER